MNAPPWPKIVLRPGIKTVFTFYESWIKVLSSQTFIYGCYCGAVVMVRGVMQVVLVVLLVTRRREVQAVIAPTENRIRVGILVNVPVRVLCAGVCLVPYSGQTSLLSHGAASGARRDHVPVVPSNADRNTPNI